MPTPQTGSQIDKKADTAWRRADIAYQYYVAYISQKPDRLALSVTDLVYVKNFKGGSTSIGEPATTLSQKLGRYERLLREADARAEFRKALGELDDREFAGALEVMTGFAALARTAEISGFGVSFSSALLHFYFPALVPILDRRALNGARIKGIEVDWQGQQVTNLLKLYPELIAYARRRLRQDASFTLRQLDRELFIQKLGSPFRASR